MTLSVAPPLALHIQPACLEHKYIRHKDSSHIFERPERLRAVLLGFAAALARVEASDDVTAAAKEAGDDLASMLDSLSLQGSFLPARHLSIVHPPPLPSSPGQVLLHHPALQLAHSPPEETEAPYPYLPRGGGAFPQSQYLKDLFKWATEAVETIRETGCEIPQDKGLNAGDLYLGPGSVVAVEGAVQTVCQAVDGVCKSSLMEHPDSPLKAFCAIRPPGHHCGEDEPSGFCYVNNVVVGALHAYLQHDVDRAIIIDFDLHHGNGTQALVMPLNEAAYAEELAVKAGKPPSDMKGRSGPRRTWQCFYGSVHDIYSYPCEDGNLDLIKDASVSLASHGQYIENIHLQPYADEADFFERIYPLYLALLGKAEVFMRDTAADPSRTVLFISAGFDACEHEHQGMQRHDRRVPASFYARFSRDISAWADAHTGGKVISVLEGGYGDRALTSGALGHAVGLMGREGSSDWWEVDELARLERAVKKRRKGKLCALPPDLAAMPHIARAHALLSNWEGAGTPAPSAAPSAAATPSGRMTLRERRPKVENEESPRPAPRRRKPASTTATPSRVEKEAPPTPTPAPNGRERIKESSPTPTPAPSGAHELGKSVDPAEVYPSPAPSAPSPEEQKPVPVSEGHGESHLEPLAATQDTLHGDAPRILLRIPARTPPPPETGASGSALPASSPAAAPLSEPIHAPAPVSAPARAPVAPPPVDRPPLAGSFRPIAPQAVVLPPGMPGAPQVQRTPSGRVLPMLYGHASPQPPQPSPHVYAPPQQYQPPQAYPHHIPPSYPQPATTYPLPYQVPVVPALPASTTRDIRDATLLHPGIGGSSSKPDPNGGL